MNASTREKNVTGDLDTIQAEARAWVRRLKAEHPTTEDAAAFKRWRAQSPAHAQAWAQAGSDWRDVEQIGLAYQALHPARSSARGSVRNSARTHGVQLGRRLFLGSALSATGAAAFAAIAYPPMGLWPSWSELHADYHTGTGEQRVVDLPGVAELTLNTQTSLSVPAATGAIRIALLSGEAALQNHGNKRIELMAGVGRIRFYKSIEVRRVDDRVHLRCLDGEAQLQHPLHTVALQAGQKISYRREAVEAVGRFDAATVSAWRQGMVEFNDTPLPEAVAEINRYRPGWLVLVNDRLADRRLSGRFRIGALDEAVTQIQTLFNTGVRTVGGVVLLG
jgi:transmembrane sensor